jgi:hypothetical protein
MNPRLIDQVVLALLDSDGMKIASREVSLERSWEMTPEQHVQYRQRALVFIKVMGQQLVKLADAEIASLDEERGR